MKLQFTNIKLITSVSINLFLIFTLINSQDQNHGIYALQGRSLPKIVQNLLDIYELIMNCIQSIEYLYNMSAKDSDNQQNTQSNKLQLENISQNNSNLFSYQNRSDKDSSSDNDAHSHEESNEQDNAPSHKLSDMLQMDQVKQIVERDDEKKQEEDLNKQALEKNELVQQKVTNDNKIQKQQQIQVKLQQLQLQKQIKLQKQQEKVIQQEQKQQNKNLIIQQLQKQPQINILKVQQNFNQKINQQSKGQDDNSKEKQQTESIQKPILKEQGKIIQVQLQTITLETQSRIQETKNGKDELRQINIQIKTQQIQQPKLPGIQATKLQNTNSQKTYQKQLEDELKLIKNNNTKKKLSEKTKELEKNKANKTLIPVTNSKQLQFQQTAQTKALELRMISTMMLEKKRQNFNLLKQWDRRRAQSLALHRNMIDIMQNQVDKRIKSSIQNLQIYTTFFRQKAKQEQRYVQHPIINTKYALQNNSISKNVYINCTVILNSLLDENVARCRKINDFIFVIRNDILRDCIEVHLTQSQKQLLKVREKISNLKAALRKINTQTEQKTTQLNVYFNQNAISLNIDNQKDFYANQIQFLQKASQQTNTQKKLGQCCLQYLQTAINQQIKRSRVIRDAMVTFSKALEQCYHIQTDPAQIQQLSKAQQTKLIQQFYSLEEIFDQRCLTMFKKNQKIDHQDMLTLSHFEKYLKRFQFQGFDSKVILLKQYHVKYIPSSKNQANKQQNCYLVITVDKFIHLFLSKQKTDPYARPDVTIKGTLKNLELKPGKNQILDIIIKDDKRNSMISYFWETKNDRIYRVQFQKRDAREEFVDYVTKIRG